MERKFKEALLHRRSYYALSNKSLVSDEEIENIVKFAVKNIPSAFNSQSTRMVLFCLLYTSPSPRDPKTPRMPSSA